MEQVRQLLDRMGIVTRESVGAENIVGGFSAVYPILRALEESGQIRRGYFIEGLGAAQFSAPGADERLRNLATPDDSTNSRTVILSAVDPANPFGSVISWPELAASEAPKPQRTTGALVIVQDGFALGYLNRSFDSLTTFRQSAQQSQTPTSVITNAIAELARSRGPIMLTSIDGFDADKSELAPDFVAAEFQSSSSGLRHRGL
ncbi:MAG: Lhr family helicase [Planctomycetales bacterium]